MDCLECGEKVEEDYSRYCKECSPQCITCGSANIVSSVYSRSYFIEDSNKLGYEEVVWCEDCGQIIPICHIKQEKPVDGLPEGYDKEEYIPNHIDTME
jgi:hypothetical protein